jgi:hypothetical protein
VTPTPACSGHANVSRASQLRHVVEHVDRYVHLDGPTLIMIPFRQSPMASPNPDLGPARRPVAWPQMPPAPSPPLLTMT